MMPLNEQELIEAVDELQKSMLNALRRIAELEKECRALRSNLMGLAKHVGSLETEHLG